MNVTNDPRIMKQILLSQWLNNANPLEPSQSEDGSLFELLLGDLVQSYSNSNSDKAALPSGGSVLPSMPSMGASLAAALAGGAPSSDHGSSSAYDGLIQAAAAKYGIDPALIKGVIQTESGFDPNAVSHAGAKGLMQLMDATARGLGVSDSLDPQQNIDGGSRFLSYLLRKYDGNVTSALAAYNAGPGRVDRLGLTTDELVRERSEELPDETQRYIGKVLAAAQRWG